jgi:hypothetical protein
MTARRREPELGYNGLESRKDRVSTIAEVAAVYLDEYRLKHKAVTFAEYAVRHLCKHLGSKMTVEISGATINQYQNQRAPAVKASTMRFSSCSDSWGIAAMHFGSPFAASGYSS